MSTSENNSQLDTSGQKPASPPQRGASEGRRRLLRGGLLGAPALLALKSAPVLACNCKLPSGFSASGNLSRSGTKNCLDRALRPSEWQQPARCPTSGMYKDIYTGTTNIKSTDLFSAHFTLGAGVPSTMTLKAALLLGDGDIKALIVAALLNAKSGNFPSGVDVPKVKLMWNSGVVGSGYTATPGVIWHQAEVFKYLQYVMGLA